MSFEPQKFFVGLMDFFSILLPGALLTLLLMTLISPPPVEELKKTGLPGVEWAAFLVVSYMSGHLVFLVSSWLDEFYDWLRRYTLNTQVFILAHRGKVLSLPARAVTRLLFKKERNLAVDRAGKIKRETLKKIGGGNSINTFQWSKAWLMKESPEALAAVERFEADSKFFRCFVVVLMIMSLVWTFQGNWMAYISLGLIPLAFWRYVEQRLKSTNQAYWSVITITAREDKIELKKKPAKFTHAGGVVFRERPGEVEYLLVEATKDPCQLVLPKGHIEDGESPNETAVREVHEETGVWARICIGSELPELTYKVDGKGVKVKFFLMKYAAWGLRTEPDRKHLWLPLEQTIEALEHDESKKLLRSADALRIAGCESLKRWRQKL